MSGLELFAIAIIAIFIYIAVIVFCGMLISRDYDDCLVLSWILGAGLFVVVIMLWAKGEPFPIGR